NYRLVDNILILNRVSLEKSERRGKRMNIGMICYPTYGGSGVVATELGKGLASKGHKVHFMSYAKPMRLNEFQANIMYHEVAVNAYPLFEYPPYDLALASNIVDLVKYENLDLIHVHYAI